MKIYKILPLWLVILIFFLFIGLIFSRFIYHNIIKNNKEYLPGFIVALIEEREGQREPSPIIYKEEKIIRILEGWTLEDIAAYLEDLGWKKLEFEKVAGRAKLNYIDDNFENWPLDFSDDFDFLTSKPKHYGLEGFLFPDTYRVFPDASAEDLVVKMLDNFDRKLTPELREEIERQEKNIYEVIIIASLIEKEAPIDYKDLENRAARIVSDIFWKRLEIGQALESDATLSYWFNDNNPSHSGLELQVDTPYNSYKYKGLPPTPICNPGLKAIEAAVYPIKTDYNYFLTSLDGKNIYYALTYQEHLDNKKYLK
jgi:UPF0755 protein